MSYRLWFFSIKKYRYSNIFDNTHSYFKLFSLETQQLLTVQTAEITNDYWSTFVKTLHEVSCGYLCVVVQLQWNKNTLWQHHRRESSNTSLAVRLEQDCVCVRVCVCGQTLGIRQACHADTQQVRSEGSLIPSIIKADLPSVRNLHHQNPVCSLSSRAACRHTTAFAFIGEKILGKYSVLLGWMQRHKHL